MINNKNLVILESPTKCKAVQNYLGTNFDVIATKGHITQIPEGWRKKNGFSFDLINFKPEYEIIRGKKTFVNAIKKNINKYKTIYLATDPDREGEAIAYHLLKLLDIENKYQRLKFNAITKEVVLDAIKQNLKLDYNLFYSQETRSILDIMIGFKLSNLLQKNVNSISAGRVQSVALKFIVDRYLERKNFTKSEYWNISGTYQNCEVNISKVDNLNFKKVLNNIDVILKLQKKLKNQFKVIDLKNKITFKQPPTTLTTSLILQKANTLFGYSVKKTNLLLQQLFEGIEIEKNLIGLITYPRSDSKRLNPKFIKLGQEYITKNFGLSFLNQKLKTNLKSKVKIQDAHEAIRPTTLNLNPLKAKKYLTNEQFKLYQLIFNTTIASLMSAQKIENQNILLKNCNCEFKILNKKTLFLGFQKILKNNDLDKSFLKNLELNQIIKLDCLNAFQKFTKPLPKYTSATLIKKLESSGIGRPSTYANTISILINRQYIIKKNNKLNLTKKGLITSEFLQKYFDHIISENYTSQIENQLDLIAQGQIKKNDLLTKFWKKFSHRLEEVLKLIVKKNNYYQNLTCPSCKIGKLIYKRSKIGDIPFVGCLNFPKCKYTKALIILQKCPQCKIGDLVLRYSKTRNDYFFGCSNYKKCPTSQIFPFEYEKHFTLFKDDENLVLNGMYIVDDYLNEKNLKTIKFF